MQDIRIKLHKTRYRLERWETPSGEAIIGQLPGDEAPFRRDPAHVRHLPIPTRHAHVTQPLILEQLREWGIEISADEISAIITEDKEAFHAEKEALLSVGLRYSRYVHVDDTGARHKGKNGYCTHIGNEQFAYFASTNSKSRINFLPLLRAGHEDYVRGDEALAYMQQQKLPKRRHATARRRLGAPLRHPSRPAGNLRRTATIPRNLLPSSELDLSRRYQGTWQARCPQSIPFAQKSHLGLPTQQTLPKHPLSIRPPTAPHKFLSTQIGDTPVHAGRPHQLPGLFEKLPFLLLTV